MKHLNRLFIVLLLSFSSLTISGSPRIQQASVYTDNVSIGDYLVSEKYDGVRAIWKAGRLVTKTGRKIFAPDWFTKDWPDVWLDGELWSKRQDFEFIQSTVLSHQPDDKKWRKIHYMVFDAPNNEQPFAKRTQYYTKIINALNIEHIRPIKQIDVSTRDELLLLLDKYVSIGAEGMMLHKKDAVFQDGRNDALLKLKPYMDAEAVVVAYEKGKGRNQGRMGSLVVEMATGLRFKIGSGFTDSERNNPPEIGEIITFKYHGLTRNSVPKFASFLRVRKQE
ncbi:DNA ligase [Marinomonas algicola]|uniref:DNA ligase n=1 Tax=Marinomonas algicola TaxID=2773454 RepID=UPI0017491740|nr:DNA ligase [Marinomonas algicola]